MICHLLCILVYDQTCLHALNSNEDDNILARDNLIKWDDLQQISVGFPLITELSSSTCDGEEVQIAWFHVILNYSLITINLVAVVSIQHGQHDMIPTRFASCVCLASVVAFQVCLCLFIADCVGVSIIWCSTFGWLIMCMQTTFSLSPTYIQSSTITSSPQSTNVARAVAFLDCGAIVFYAVVSDVIGTIAHCLAVALGIVLWKVAILSHTYNKKAETKQSQIECKKL